MTTNETILELVETLGPAHPADVYDRACKIAAERGLDAGLAEVRRAAAADDAEDYGYLHNYVTGEYLRPATYFEHRASLAAGPEGVIEVTINGKRTSCFVQ